MVSQCALQHATRLQCAYISQVQERPCSHDFCEFSPRSEAELFIHRDQTSLAMTDGSCKGWRAHCLLRGVRQMGRVQILQKQVLGAA